MDKNGDFGPLLEVLVTCVGVVDVIALFAYMFDRKQKFESEPDENDKEVKRINSRRDLLKPVPSPRGISPMRPTTPIPEFRIEPDGAPQSPSSFRNDDLIEELSEKVHELERKINDLEVMEMERSREASVERFLDIDRYRRSRSPSPELHRSRTCSPDRNMLDVDEEYEAGTSSRSSSRQGRVISRDDSLRRTIRRSSNKSLASQSSREEELEQLSMLEQEEQQNLEDFVPIIYDEPPESHQTYGGFSPIQETSCPIHGDMEYERSPAPELAGKVDLPWGDVKRDSPLIKHQDRFELARSMSIEEEPNEEEKNFNQDEVLESLVGTEDALMAKPQSGLRNIAMATATEEFIKHETVVPLGAASNQASQEFIEYEKIADLGAKVLYKDEPSASLEATTIKEVQEAPKSEEISYENMKPVEEPLIVPKQARELSTERFMVTAPLAEPEEDFQRIATEAIVPGTPESARKVIETTVEQQAHSSSSPDKHPSDVSNPKVTLNNQEHDELAANQELMNISRPSSGEGLKRTKRCLNSLDRSISRSPTPRLRSSRSRSRSRVPSEADYKDWFGKFNNQDSPELEVPDDVFDYEEVEEEQEEEISLEHYSDAQVQDLIKKKLTTSANNDVTLNLNCNESVPKIVNDVSISVTLNLHKKKSENLSSSGDSKSDTEDFIANERQHAEGYRRMSIIPSTEEEQAKFTSILHPEEFPPIESSTPHIHHQHIHNKGYSEWIKKLVEHSSSHLSLSDSDSDSDSPLNETDCIPHFQKDTQKKKRKNRFNAQRPSPNSTKI